MRRPVLLALALTGLAWGLRLHRLADKAVWFDEGWNAWMARFDWVEIVRRVSTDTAPPLHFWLLHLWRAGLGESAFALRLLSVAAGVLAVAVTYRLGRRIGGVGVGALAAGLTAISRFHISWSQEIRMYSLGALLAALALWGALRVWERGERRDYLLYLVGVTAGLYNHYLAAFVWLAINVAWLWEAGAAWRQRTQAEQKRRLVGWLAAQLVVLALFAPWLVYALGRMRSWSAEAPITFITFLKVTWTTLSLGIPAAVESFAPLTLPLALAVGVGLLLLAWATRQRANGYRVGRNLTLLATGLVLPGVLIFLLSLPGRAFLYTPPVAPRYFMLFVSAYAVLIAWSVTRLGAGRRWPLGLAAGAWAVGVALYGLMLYYPGRILQDDYQSLADTLHAYQQPQDAVVLYTDVDWPTFDFYVGPGWWGVPSSWQLTPEQAAAYLGPIWQAHAGIWLATMPYALASDPQGVLPAWLATQAAQSVTYSLGDKALTFYARTPARAAALTNLAPDHTPSQTLDRLLEDKWRLLGYDQPAPVYESGQLIHLALYWEAGPGTPTPRRLLLQDAAGRMWTEAVFHAPLADDNPRQIITLRTPPEAPDGVYQVVMGPEQIVIGQVEVRQKARAILRRGEVPIPIPYAVAFAQGIRLLGYDLDADQAQPGGEVHLTLYWATDQPILTRYKVFTHLLGDQYNATTQNFLWGQQDNEPVHNRWPTTLWRTDEVILDPYAIPVDPQAPAGAYVLEIGLYDPVTGERVSVLEAGGAPAGDHIRLTLITLTAP